MSISMSDEGPFRLEGHGAVVGNEFAEVAVSVDSDGLTPRLRLEDLRSGRVRLLDPLEVEAIIWMSELRLTSLLDPSADRWGEGPAS